MPPRNSTRKLVTDAARFAMAASASDLAILQGLMPGWFPVATPASLSHEQLAALLVAVVRAVDDATADTELPPPAQAVTSPPAAGTAPPPLAPVATRGKAPLLAPVQTNGSGARPAPASRSPGSTFDAGPPPHPLPLPLPLSMGSTPVPEIGRSQSRLPPLAGGGGGLPPLPAPLASHGIIDHTPSATKPGASASAGTSPSSCLHTEWRKHVLSDTSGHGWGDLMYFDEICTGCGKILTHASDNDHGVSREILDTAWAARNKVTAFTL
jgi:hypothetical protein